MHWIDPLHDTRWSRLVARHPDGSVFHTVAWLKALHRTYGYRTLVLTSCSPEEELSDGIPFCEVNSWINGYRLVSLPFSDHCQPLLKCREDWAAFRECLTSHCGQLGWKYVEIRPAKHMTLDDAGTRSLLGPRDQWGSSDDGSSGGFTEYQTYKLHRIDLRSDLATLFNNFHKSCIRRKIGRAEREGLEYEAGRSESNLTEFYRMLVLTRRRRGLPPQPMVWFRNLKDCFGEGLTIHIASKQGRAIAAVLTLLYKGTLVYKYGCSEAAFHNLGAMPMLFWKTIQSGKYHGAQEFDLGRSDMDNPGLSVFKQHLGASGSELAYFRLGRNRVHASKTSVSRRIASTVFTRMPGPLAQMAGSVLYRHMG